MVWFFISMGILVLALALAIAGTLSSNLSRKDDFHGFAGMVCILGVLILIWFGLSKIPWDGPETQMREACVEQSNVWLDGNCFTKEEALQWQRMESD